MKVENFQELVSRVNEAIEGASEIISETAVEYFQNTFRDKKFDGNPWAPPRVPKRSGSPERIVIAAGNEKVDYAQVHNEGFKGSVTIPAHIRHTRRGNHTVRQHTRRVNIPKRQFIGDARELETELQKRIEAYVESVLNN